MRARRLWISDESQQAKNNVAGLELARHLGVCYRTAWLIKQKIMEVMRQRETGRPQLVCFSKRTFTKESFWEFMFTSIALPAAVVSDGLNCFTVAQEIGIVHHRTVTGSGPASVEVEHHWAVNTVLGNLKTAMTGTCHAIKFAKYAHRYLAEVQYRFNWRHDLRAILARLVRAAAATPAKNETEIRAC